MPSCGRRTQTVRTSDDSPRRRRSGGRNGRRRATRSRSRSTANSRSSGWFARTVAVRRTSRPASPRPSTRSFRPSDGRQVTFRGKATDGTWGLYVIGRDGSGLTRLDLDPGFATDENYDINADYYTLEPDPTSIAGPGFRIHIADVSPTAV